jgi:hypothetical protein
MTFADLNKQLQIAVTCHNNCKEMLYFGKGPSESVTECKKVFLLMKQNADKSDYKKSGAIAAQKLFTVVKNHIDQIRQNYPNNESKLLYTFLRKLIPGKIAPLNFPVLSQLSLCSVVVQINSEKYNQKSITAYVDGYYDFVIPVGGNVIRIPLIPKDGETPITLPPSIRFLGTEKERKKAQDFIVARAPKIGRNYQFHSFISLISHSDPRLGPFAAFKDAVTSFDLSFATTIADLAYEENSKAIIPRLVNVLGCSKMLDHFIRVLATNSRFVVSAIAPDDNPEFSALINMFVAPPFDWADELKDMTFDELIQTLCYDKLRLLPDISKYVLRAAIVIACYQDPRGDVAIAMFMELYVKPFARKLFLESNYQQEKDALLKHQPINGANAEALQKAIVTLLGMDIEITLQPSAVENDISNLYNFCLENVDKFVRLIIILNARPKEQNPVLQAMLFAYKLTIDNDVEDTIDETE